MMFNLKYLHEEHYNMEYINQISFIFNIMRNFSLGIQRDVTEALLESELESNS
jgi:hypothetical protein